MKISESFADTKHSSKRCRRKREDFLERMDKLIPWALFVDLVSRTVRTAAGGAPRTHWRQFSGGAASSCSSIRATAGSRIFRRKV